MKRLGPGFLTAVVVAIPSLLVHVLPAGILPPAIAFFGQATIWLALSAALAFADLTLPRRGPAAVELAESALKRVEPCRLAWAIGLAGFTLAIAAMPDYRWSGAFAGDEPKYLRMAESLGRDLEVDVAGGATQPPDLRRLAAGLRSLAFTTRDAAVGLARGEATPPDHVWNLGNWTVAGRHGGRFYVQSPGLSVLLAPMWALQALLPDSHTPEFHALLILALLFGATLAQTAALASEVSGSRLAGLLAALLVTTSAPLLVGGLHFYPEAAAAPFVAWCARPGLSVGPRLTTSGLLLVGLGAGSLVWLHPKYVPLAAVLLVLAAYRAGEPGGRPDWRRCAVLVAGAAPPVLARVLYDHRITGLLSPDALYRRFGSDVYSGPDSLAPWKLAAGLATGPFGHRDGLLVMAPIVIIAALALPVCWRESRRVTLSLLLAVGALWTVASVHEGGAPGPPGRLLAPVAPLAAALIARALVARCRALPFRWTFVFAALVGTGITLAQLGDWRLTVDPYRELLTPETDLVAVLPGAPASPELPLEARRQRDALRGLILAAVLGLAALGLDRFGSRPDPTDAWPLARRAIAFVVVFWLVLGATSGVLARLAP
ncbi:MAG: hypothetical protein AB7O37_17255 [Vicinamibacteria bacterium]